MFFRTREFHHNFTGVFASVLCIIYNGNLFTLFAFTRVVFNLKLAG
jgi:hypothetical protein